MPELNGDNGDNLLDYRNITYGPPTTWPVDQTYYQINAFAGDDVVYGTKWGDYVVGGSGDDLLYGFNGHDALYGGDGSDTLYGGDGNDYLLGETGDDFLWGENGSDSLTGGAGSDQLAGGAGSDVLNGNDDDDLLFGEAGDDTLFGGYGADVLDGGIGNDRLWGDAGNDQYQFGGNGKHTINDGVNPAGYARTEATYDTDDVLILTGPAYTAEQIQFYQVGSDLVITSLIDVADGSLDNSVTIEDFFLGGHYKVEWLETYDFYTFDLTSLLAI